MTLQQLLQNATYKQKFVLEKLIKAYLGYEREAMRLHLEQEIPDAPLQRILQGYTAYTVDKKPLEYILGHVDFFGVPFYVNEHTIIPRPETEYMITAVSEFIREQQATSSGMFTLLDIGTGSGILGISLLLQHPNAFEYVFLSDISEEALSVAEQNYDTLIKAARCDTKFVVSDLAAFVESAEVMQEFPLLLVANLPYIPDETFDTNALENVQKREPRLAFVGGNDGLDLYRKLFHQLLEQAGHLASCTMFLEMMSWQIEILKAEFGEWLVFEEVKTFHFNIRIVKVWMLCNL
jgi:release factor glutamine methyltransferase